MTILIVLAAVVLAPAALLALNGPGEIELVTEPKNLGLLGAEIVTRQRIAAPAVEDISGSLRNAEFGTIYVKNHAAHIPAGMRVGADA